jgi:site-specific DNA-methyltransferase (adenine-specific)
MELNKIYNESCLDTMSRMSDNFIDLTVTSPPYNLGKKHHTRNKIFDSYDVYNDNLPEDIYQSNQIEILNELFRVTKVGGSLMYNHKNRIRNGVQITPYEWLLKTDWNIKQEIVWFNGSPNFDNIRFYPMTERVYWLSKGVKTGFKNDIKSHDVIKESPVGTKDQHKRAFPLNLVKKFLVCFNDADVVYDPFMGSGTTAVAAKELKRNYIGSEISEEYVKLANRRIAEMPQTLF